MSSKCFVSGLSINAKMKRLLLGVSLYDFCMSLSFNSPGTVGTDVKKIRPAVLLRLAFEVVAGVCALLEKKRTVRKMVIEYLIIGFRKLNDELSLLSYPNEWGINLW